MGVGVSPGTDKELKNCWTIEWELLRGEGQCERGKKSEELESRGVMSKGRDTRGAKLEPPAAIRLIGRAGQQRSIDGSITLSIWWPNHAGLARQSRSPRFCLSYCGRRSGLTLTQENLSHHLCWFTPGLRCPVNPFDQLTWTILMQGEFMLPVTSRRLKYEVESWQRRCPPAPKLMPKEQEAPRCEALSLFSLLIIQH